MRAISGREGGRMQTQMMRTGFWSAAYVALCRQHSLPTSNNTLSPRPSGRPLGTIAAAAAL